MPGDVLHRIQRSRTPDEPEYKFFCPGCRCAHWFKTTGARPRWSFNGDLERPTVKPAILVSPDVLRLRCHVRLVGGQLKYRRDCHHRYAGRTIDMVAFPAFAAEEDYDALETE